MFDSKRVCEKWLDACFIDLYEDLQVFSNWEHEVTPPAPADDDDTAASMKEVSLEDSTTTDAKPAEQKDALIARTPLELELLGDLAVRLRKLE